MLKLRPNINFFLKELQIGLSLLLASGSAAQTHLFTVEGIHMQSQALHRRHNFASALLDEACSFVNITERAIAYRKRLLRYNAAIEVKGFQLG